MNARLLAWTVVLTLAVAGARWFPPAGVVVSLLAPLLALLWAWTRGAGAGVAAAVPGGVVLAWAGPEALPVYAASVFGGVVVARLLAAGWSFGTAVAVGAAPFAVWTVGLAVTGFDPVSAEFMGRWEGLIGVTQGGAELRQSADAAVAILRNTWVASEVLWFAGLLAFVTVLARRMEAGRNLPAPGRWKSLDLPDALVGVLIAGLLLVLFGGGAALQAAGWNLVFGCGVLYALRGIGIEIFWLDRGRVGRGMRAVFFIGNLVFFLPVFLVLSAVLGLLDTWFDFRRQRGSERGGHPLSLFHHSSGDDLKE
ncbi:YybS family protein [bacterium]|nr:YybS family protein [bacterium]